jgi:isoquinoline 1-oxidoreductase subunit alpha
MANMISIRVNGVVHEVNADPQTSLLSVLRDQLELTGTKYGCGEAQCGACTVLIDGHPRRSCITAVGTAAKRHVVTIEGLERHGRLHPVQEAFLREEALQCGYCTPGMIMSAVAFLESSPHPTGPELERAMEGNICRCGAYPRIVAAIQRAARKGEES